MGQIAEDTSYGTICKICGSPLACNCCTVENVQRLHNELTTAKFEIRSLRDVVAVIHRDGGYYQKQHGYQKASKDALVIIAKERKAFSHLFRENKNLKAEAQKHLTWMIATLNFQKEQTGFKTEDSAEMRDAKQFLIRLSYQS